MLVDSVDLRAAPRMQFLHLQADLEENQEHRILCNFWTISALFCVFVCVHECDLTRE